MGAQGEFFERHIPSLDIADGDDPNGGLSVGGIIDMASDPAPDVASNIAAGTMTDPPPSRRMMKDLSIPKLYYSISEVSRLTGLEAYVLRYWETEFEELRPQKNRAGNRIYSNRDIKFILRIKELLREQRYTIDGAKHIIRGERVADARMVELKAEGARPDHPEDPAQLPLPADVPKIPSTPVTLDEIRAMKSSLEDLRAVFRTH